MILKSTKTKDDYDYVIWKHNSMSTCLIMRLSHNKDIILYIAPNSRSLYDNEQMRNHQMNILFESKYMESVIVVDNFFKRLYANWIVYNTNLTYSKFLWIMYNNSDFVENFQKTVKLSIKSKYGL